MAIPSPEILRPSPLDLGATLSGAVRVFRQRLGNFVLIALLQGVATAVLIFGAVALFVVGVFRAIQREQVAGLLVLGIVVLFAAFVGSFLIQVKTQAMLVLGAHDEIHGQPSTIGDLFRRTSGVALRVLVLGLALIGAIFVIYGVLVALIVGTAIRAAQSSDPGSALSAFFATLAIFVVVIIALAIAAIYLTVRFLYLIPALAVEGRGAVDGLKRSWALTKGNVWRTLGYYLIASLIVSAISYVVQLIPQTFMTAAMDRALVTDEPFAAFSVMFPFMALLTLLQIAVQLLATPFLSSYITVMYVDQVRRNEMVQPLAAGGFPGQPHGSYDQNYGAGSQHYGSGPQQPYGPSYGQQQWGQDPNKGRDPNNPYGPGPQSPGQNPFGG
ncbi:MAG TPA: hypothetical protein GXZ30_03450 [Propionibacterium sp.]|nr:hypothetical protein [Propionibacterium sp.]